jgi:hypothetical protein
MKIAVCVPCYYGHVHYIDRLLASISDQTRIPDIVSISISGYPKDIEPISYSGNLSVRFIHTPDDKNAAENRNIAARAVVNEVDIINFFDADDYMHPRRIEIIETAFSDKITQVFFHNYFFVSRSLLNIAASREICKNITITNTILTDAVHDDKHADEHFGRTRIQSPDGSSIPHHNGHISCTSDVFRLQECCEGREFLGCEDSHYSYLLYTRGLNIKCSPDMLSLYSSL